jgi:hypothetical protein
LNVIVPLLSERFTKIAWVDCDLLWLRRGWLWEASRLLEEWPVVQCFSDLIWETKDGRPGKLRPGFARSNQPGSWNPTCPGGAWAARRELWSRFGGLYDCYPWGGADEMAAAAFNAAKECKFVIEINPACRLDYLRWARPVMAWTEGRIGMVESAVRHLWHGEREHRNYHHRHQLMARFDPERDLTVNVDGLWEWGERVCQREFAAYFAGRREDG